MLDIRTGEYVGLRDGDVPAVFKYNGRNYVLGRYLRRRLRRAVFMPEPEPKAVGEMRSFKRQVDLVAAGKSGWRQRELQREHVRQRALKKDEISRSRKGFGL